MRIGIDFDNTIICYDAVFSCLAKKWQLIEPHWQGTKQQIRDRVRMLPDGDTLWQRMQGKAYGELIDQATLFPGFKEFILACQQQIEIDLFIISHKTEFGHFDEKHISLREASRHWLRQQGLFDFPILQKDNIYFESTREEKIARIQSLQCTHFIDDLPEVLYHPSFPPQVKRFLLQQNTSSTANPAGQMPPRDAASIQSFPNWYDIQHAIFSHGISVI